MTFPIIVDLPQEVASESGSIDADGPGKYIRADLVFTVLTQRQKLELLTKAVGDLFDTKEPKA